MSKGSPETRLRAKPLIPGTTAPKPPRMRPALRAAIDEIVYKGSSVPDAAKRADMHPVALYRALRRQDIADYVEHLKAQAIIDGSDLRARAKAMAIRVGMDLLHHSSSDAVKARMVEFFASEAKPAGPTVAVQVNNHSPSGYVYVKPGDQDQAPPKADT